MTGATSKSEKEAGGTVAPLSASFSLEREEWFQNLVDDCKTIIVETEFTARWALIEGYHQLGCRILEECEKQELSPEQYSDLLQCIGENINKKQSSLYYSVQFAIQYPDLSMLPEGKNVTWYKICNEILPAKTPHVALSTGENEWYTPEEYIKAAHSTMGGIDCDPASSDEANKIVGAKTHFTIGDNGLEKSWHGKIWMNPPYSQPDISLFCKKLQNELESGNTKEACVLINNATETAFFQDLLSIATAICFPRGRVRFIDKEGNSSGAPLQGQAVLYFGENVNLFANSFSIFGMVVVPWNAG